MEQIPRMSDSCQNKCSCKCPSGPWVLQLLSGSCLMSLTPHCIGRGRSKLVRAFSIRTSANDLCLARCKCMHGSALECSIDMLVFNRYALFIMLYSSRILPRLTVENKTFLLLMTYGCPRRAFPLCEGIIKGRMLRRQ